MVLSQFQSYIEGVCQMMIQTPYSGVRSRYDNRRFREYHLRNGIVVHIQEPDLIPHYGGILIAYFPSVGSCVEAPDEHGIMHFFEHVMVDEKVLRPVKDCGGDYNASVSKMCLQFYTETSKEDFQIARQGLMDMICAPTLTAEVLERERKVVTAEYHSRLSAMYFSDKAFIESFYGKNHPLGHVPIGDMDVIQSASASILEDFRVKYHHAGNMRLVVGGSFAEFDHAWMLEQLELAFGHMSHSVSTLPGISIPLQRKGETVITSSEKFLKDTLSIMYFGGDPLNDADKDALDFLGKSLRGMSSPVMQELRMKRQLVYATSMSADYSSNGWFLTFECSSDRSNFPEIKNVFVEALEGLDDVYFSEVQGIRQKSRMGRFLAPIDACDHFVDFTSWGLMTFSEHEQQSMEDELDIDLVFAWRDRLLHDNPFVFEVLSE